MLRILVPAGLAGRAGEGYGRAVLKPGDRAPDFPLKFRTLYDLLGESAVVLFFFPKAFTPG
jgi:hypothetical protein